MKTHVLACKSRQARTFIRRPRSFRVNDTGAAPHRQRAEIRDILHGPRLQRSPQDEGEGLPEGTALCEGSQWSSARQAARQGRWALGFVSRRLGKIAKDPSLRATFESFFGAYGEGSPEEEAALQNLSGKVEAMRSHLASRVPGRQKGGILCGAPDSEKCPETTVAYTDDDNDAIVVCGRFFAEDRTDQDRVHTMVHEAAHLVLATGTDIYRHQPIYEWLDQVATRNESAGSAALQNPDSLAAFVLSVASNRRPKLRPEEGKEEKAEEWEGFEGETETADQQAFRLALAWLQQWLTWAVEDIGKFLDNEGNTYWNEETENRLRRYALTPAEPYRDRLFELLEKSRAEMKVQRASTPLGGDAVIWHSRLEAIREALRRREPAKAAKARVELSDAFFEASGEDQARLLLDALRLSRPQQAGLERLTDFVVANADRHLGKHGLVME